MLLLVSGASGVGKSTARIHALPLLDDTFEAVELWHLGPIPAAPTVAWRQEMVEVAVRRAVRLQAEGRHLLLAGDPIPAGEVLAAPSADAVDIAACLLDADEAAQSARLRARQDPAELLVRHLAFAAWMRVHAVDPGHLTEVVTNDAWPPMEWDRWVGRPAGSPWAMSIIDISTLAPTEAGARVAEWCRDAVRGDVPVFETGWFRATPH
jgi:hypothetical protein